MRSAIVFRYSRPHPGREKMGFQAFGEALAFFGKQAAEGACELPVAYMPPAGGGMMIVHGEREQLQAILGGEEFARVYYRAGYTVPELTYELMIAGEDTMTQMGLWGTVGGELGVM